MKHIILIISTIILLTDCTKQNSEVSVKLKKAAECIEQYPDSSLDILNTLQLNNITIQEERACYALLKSIALDKNYIDVTSDSLTSIALAYYKKHGTADEKLKAFYYSGVVCHNRENYDGAMDNFLKAEKFVAQCNDFVQVGRLYNMKVLVSKIVYSIDDAIKPAELSAFYYLKGQDTVRYITALNNLSSILLAAHRCDSAKVYFPIIIENKKYMTLKHWENYYSNLINYKIAVSDSTLKNSINESLEYFADRKASSYWIVLARTYCKIGDYKSALHALNSYKRTNSKLSNLYYYHASLVYGALGDYRQAYESLIKYQNASDTQDFKIFSSDAKFIEERYLLNEQKLKLKYFIIILSLSVILILIVTVLFIKYLMNINRTRKNKIAEMEEHKNKLQNEYEKALIEKKKLQSLISENTLDKGMRIVLEERLQILNRFIVANISGINMDKSQQELKNYVSNNEYFLQSTRLSFEITHPKFISYLKSKNLSEWEISCCCLYCIGLNGTEISNFLDIKYFYKKTAIIRKKIGIQSVNIDTFLLNKIKQLS